MRPFKTGGKKVMKSQKTIKPAGFYKDIKNIAKELIRAGNWTKFAKDHERAYRAALKYFSKKRLGDMTGIKPAPRVPVNYYKNINNIAKKLKAAGSWSAFQKKHASAYHSIKPNFTFEALEKLTGIYRIPKNTPKVWTEEKIRAKAKEHKTRHQFRQKAAGAANAADRLGIFESVCAHMPRGQIGWLYGIYSIVSKSNKLAYVGLTRNLDRRKINHFDHENNDCRSRFVVKHSDAKFRILTKCVLNETEAVVAEKKAYSSYLKRGFKLLNDPRCLGRIGTIHEMHTEKTFKKRVDKFKGTIEDFYKSTERSCIQKAREHGWLQYAYDSLPSRKVSFAEAKGLAAQCKKVSEFVKKHPRQADMARNRGWLPKITTHMENPTPLEGRVSAKWGTEERIWAEIYKYSIFRQFIKESNGAYKAIARFPGLSEKIKDYFAGLKAGQIVA